MQLKPLLNGGPSHRPSETIRQQGLIWFKTGKLQPGADVMGGFLPEGYRALLSAFAQQLHGAVIVSLDVLHPHGESFGNSGAGIIEKKKEQMAYGNPGRGRSGRRNRTSCRCAAGRPIGPTPARQSAVCEINGIILCLVAHGRQ